MRCLSPNSRAGGQPGQRPKSDRLAAKVIRMIEEEKLSYRIVAKRLDLSKNTVLEIMKRHRHADTAQAALSI